MEVRSLLLPLKAFGVKPGSARVELGTLSVAERLKRAGTMIAFGMIVSLIALPIPIVHLVLVPGGVVLGIVASVVRLNQREVFRHVEGRCPFCGSDQSFTVIGRFKLPKRLYCASCHRELLLEGPTTALPHSPT